MLKQKSDDELAIMEKPLKKKQISLNSYSSCSSSSNKAKTNNETKKTFSSLELRLAKYKTVEENWIERSLAPFYARIWF